MPHKDWMAPLDDNTLFMNLTLPGSHDAGVFLQSNSTRVKCQDRDLMQQCYAGSRFFDLRAYKKGFGAGSQMRFGHFFEPVKPMRGRAIAGSFGGSLDVELANIRLFLEAEPTETVILRFSHIAHSGSVMGAVTAALGPRLYRGAGNVATMHLGAVGDPNSLRGKAIACFDTDEFTPNSGMGIIPFQKYRNDGVSRNGLVTCGAYANKSELSAVVRDQMNHYMAHQSHPRHDDHLLVVYWQQTGGNVQQNTLGGVHTELANFCGALSGGGAQPNVILHDFVNPATCKTIVDAFNGVVV